jgi:hypothetical protein
MKRSALIALAAATTVGCSTRSDIAVLRSTSNNKANLIVQCASPQGNGGNWATTLGWIAEEWMVLSERANFLQESTNRPTYVFMRCMSGGSSGSGATNVTMNLLKNKKVLKNAEVDTLWEEGFFTPEQVKDYARAMRFLANSVDMNVKEHIIFFASMFRESRIAKNQRDMQTADWWEGAVASGPVAVADFGKLAHAAGMVTSEHVNTPIDQILSWETLEKIYGHFKFAAFLNAGQETASFLLAKVFDGLKRLSSAEEKITTLQKVAQFAQAERIQNAADFVIYKDRTKLNCGTKSPTCRIPAAIMKVGWADIRNKDPNGHPEVRYAYHFLIEAAQAFHAGFTVDTIIADAKSAASSPQQPNPFARQMRLNDSDPRLTTLIAPMDPGYFTVTTAALTDSDEYSNNNKPNYKDIKMVIFGSDDTMQMIKNSALYNSHTSNCKDNRSRKSSPNFTCRFVLASVDKAVYSLLPSVREPGLMNELYLPAQKGSEEEDPYEHMGINSFFDPVRPERNIAQTKFAVTGGWPDRRISNWMMMYYLDSLLSTEKGNEAIRLLTSVHPELKTA